MSTAYPLILTETDDLPLWLALTGTVAYWNWRRIWSLLAKTLRARRARRYSCERDAMSFADPQTITINAVAQTLPRVSSGVNAGAFKKDDGTVSLSVTHAYGKRTRRVLRVDHSKIAADPLISAQNIKYSMGVQLIIDTPVTGYTVTEAKQIADALVAYLSASSGARITQLLGGEN